MLFFSSKIFWVGFVVATVTLFLGGVFWTSREGTLYDEKDKGKEKALVQKSPTNAEVLLMETVSFPSKDKQFAVSNQPSEKAQISTKPLDAYFFYNTDLGKAIFAYLSCIDFDCIETLQAIVKKGSDAVLPLTQIFQSGVPLEIAAKLSGDVPLLVRIRVIEALGALADTRALNTIVGALQDSNPLVRAGVAGSLGKIGGDEALAALLLLLRDTDPLVRETTTQALMELKRPEALSALHVAVESETQEHIRRAMDTAIRVLEKY